MDIFFEDQHLRSICASESGLIQLYGKTCGPRINRRLCILASADSVDDIPREPPDSMQIYGSDSRPNFRIGCCTFGFIYFEPVATKVSRPVLTRIKKILIIRIERGK